MRVRRPWTVRWARWFDAVAAEVLPAHCFACSRYLSRYQYLGACASCWASLHPLPRPACERCALPIGGSWSGERLTDRRCLRCAVQPFPLDEAVAAVRYEGVAKRFLLHAKERYRPDVLRPLAVQLAAAIEATGLLARVDVVVPVPSTLAARLRRGFEPARELAREVALAEEVAFRPRTLRRRRLSGRAFKGLGAADRWKRARDEIVVRERLPGLRVLLVDDVMTTGATVAACARALRDGGATEVRAAIWARTPAHQVRL